MSPSQFHLGLWFKQTGLTLYYLIYFLFAVYTYYYQRWIKSNSQESSGEPDRGKRPTSYYCKLLSLQNLVCPFGPSAPRDAKMLLNLNIFFTICYIIQVQWPNRPVSKTLLFVNCPEKLCHILPMLLWCFLLNSHAWLHPRVHYSGTQ